MRFPSAVTVRVNGVVAGRHELPDDPADHRGILSWHAQLKDKKLREAGSYGYLLEVEVPRAALERAAASGALEIRLEVDPALPGGLAHLRRALRALSGRPHGGLHPKPVTKLRRGRL